MFLKRAFTTSTRYWKKFTSPNLKGKSTSSQHWLTRQLADPYVEKAKMLNYRCRSAFKLLEMNEKHLFLKPGHIVIDCGAAPGSWTQVAVKKVNADESKPNLPVGKVIAIDKQQIYPIQGATIFGNLDFTLSESQDKILQHLEDKKVDGVLSDMAPAASGIKDLDKENIIHLCYAALRFAVQVSKVNAYLVVKLWQCGQTGQLEKDLSRFYRNVKVAKPNSSRSDSAEIFFLARNFRGLTAS